MVKEIQQPNFPRPDLKDPFTWALISRIHTEWVRQVGPQLDVDVEKYVCGSVLTKIIHDDSNCFNWMMFGDKFFDSDIAIRSKRNLIERMDWEITTPETPSAIRDKCMSTLEAISSLDWSDKDHFDEAKTEWYKFKRLVEGLVEGRPDLKEAEEYMLVQNGRLSPYWNEFLYGSQNSKSTTF